MTPDSLFRISLLAPACALLIACTSPLQAPVTPTVSTPPDKWFHQSEAVAPAAEWWRQLGSDELNLLLSIAMRDNPDVQIARERLISADESLRQARADRWPSVSVRAGASHKKDLDGSGEGFNSGSSLSFSAGYEVDLWARRASDIDSSELDYESQRIALRSVEMTLTGQVVQQYIALLAARESLGLARSNLAASQELERIMQVKFDAGAVSGVELAQQRNTTLSLVGRLAALETALHSEERALAYLVGVDELRLPELTMTLEELDLPQVARIQPASLLEQRPDIRQASIALWQAHADVWQAESSRWPSLSLSAGLSAYDVISPTGWALSLGESLSMPLFDAGKIKAQIAQAESAERTARIQYRAIVTAAMLEALDALGELDYQVKALANSEAVFENNRRLLRLATIRFDSGDTDFTSLLSAQRTFFSARDAMLSARQSHLQALAALYLTLGDIPRN